MVELYCCQIRKMVQALQKAFQIKSVDTRGVEVPICVTNVVLVE